jgi:short-subunit dehydrogenase
VNSVPDPHHIAITGASSGIGAALALAYAGPGILLSLAGRDTGRLSAVAQACREVGADTSTGVFDVTDPDAAAHWINEADDRLPIDLVIANAGISAGTGDVTETAEQARNILKVNIDGVCNIVSPAILRMQARRRGQVAIMSSLAGFIGVPGAPAYCASKAAIRVWGEALRADLTADGLGVSVICPGFVRSPMTDINRFPMPFLMDADRAARIIVAGLARNKARIAFPLPMYLAVRSIAALPAWLRDRAQRQAPRKP